MAHTQATTEISTLIVSAMISRRLEQIRTTREARHAEKLATIMASYEWLKQYWPFSWWLGAEPKPKHVKARLDEWDWYINSEEYDERRLKELAVMVQAASPTNRMRIGYEDAKALGFTEDYNRHRGDPLLVDRADAASFGFEQDRRQP